MLDPSGGSGRASHLSAVPNDPLASSGSPPPVDVADRVRRSSVWSAVNTVLMRLVNIIVMAVVARLVVPEEFGIFTLTMVAFLMIQAIGELGVTAALARRDLDLDEVAPTVVTIAWVTSAALAILLFLFAPSVAALLGSKGTTIPLQIMSVCLLLGGPSSVPAQQLQRDFRGDRVFRANLIAFVFATATLLGLAVLGAGAVAFALSRVVGQLVTGIALQLLAPRFYLPGFRWAVARRVLPFGIPISLSTLLQQLLINVDAVLIGRLLSVTAVGVYNLAFNVGTWSAAVLQATLSAVVLPAFSHVFAERGDPHRAMRRAVEATLVLAFPIATVTSALAVPLVQVVYGDQWTAAGPVLSVLSVYGVISVVGLLLSDVLIASGRTGVLALIQVGALILLLPAMWGGISLLGLKGAGVAHSLVILLGTIPLYLIALRRTLDISPRDVLAPIALPFVGACVAGAAGFAVTLLPWTPLLQLVVGGSLIGAIYVTVTGRALRRLLSADGTSGLHRLLDAIAVPSTFVSRRMSRLQRIST